MTNIVKIYNKRYAIGKIYKMLAQYLQYYASKSKKFTVKCDVNRIGTYTSVWYYHL